jgi:hypothetical protein
MLLLFRTDLWRNEGRKTTLDDKAHRDVCDGQSSALNARHLCFGSSNSHSRLFLRITALLCVIESSRLLVCSNKTFNKSNAKTRGFTDVRRERRPSTTQLSASYRNPIRKMFARAGSLPYRRLSLAAGNAANRSRAAPIRGLQTTTDPKPKEHKPVTVTSDAGLISQEGAPAGMPKDAPDYHAVTDYRTS